MKHSESCGFGALSESLIRDRLILGVKDDRVCQKLLGKPDLDLYKAIETIKLLTRERQRSQKNFQLTKILMQWGKGRNSSAGKVRIANLPPRTLARLKSVCFVVVHMHWKGNCVQFHVRNVTSVAKKTNLQSSVGASLKMQKFIWLNRKKSFTSIVSEVKIKLLFRSL